MITSRVCGLKIVTGRDRAWDETPKKQINRFTDRVIVMRASM
jgi:hypothetical protein